MSINSSAVFSPTAAVPSLSPALEINPSVSQSRPGRKPAKKRKPWGQILPQPKTSLPPRRRAKTEDEKEQRRIERIQRNRLAAHTSRERKRQEIEQLQSQVGSLETGLKTAHQAMAYMAAELEVLRTERTGIGFDAVSIDKDSYTISRSDIVRPAVSVDFSAELLASVAQDDADRAHLDEFFAFEQFSDDGGVGMADARGSFMPPLCIS